jgi:hypothetical protein
VIVTSPLSSTFSITSTSGEPASRRSRPCARRRAAGQARACSNGRRHCRTRRCATASSAAGWPHKPAIIPARALISLRALSRSLAPAAVAVPDPLLRSRPQLLVVGREIPLARSAHGTEPGLGNVLERGARRDPSVRVALLRIVDEPAGLTHPFHRRKPSAPSSTHAGDGSQAASKPSRLGRARPDRHAR